MVEPNVMQPSQHPSGRRFPLQISAATMGSAVEISSVPRLDMPHATGAGLLHLSLRWPSAAYVLRKRGPLEERVSSDRCVTGSAGGPGNSIRINWEGQQPSIH